MQQKSELPEGWVWTTIGDICNLINGRAFKPQEWSTKGIPIVRIQNLNNIDSEFNYCDFQVDDKYKFSSGQLLFCWSGTPGTSFGAHIWNRGEAVLNQHIFRVLIDESYINKKFLMHLMNWNILDYIKQAHGTAGLAHITKKNFESSFIPIPPLSEQHRIVSTIEALFFRLDTTNEKLDRVQEVLKKFRESVLAAAYEGRLTENWRVKNFSVESADEILDKILKERVISKPRKLTEFDEANIELNGLPENWVWKPLKEISINSDYGTSVKCDYEFKGFPVLRIPNISEGKVDLSDLKFASEGDNFPNLKFLRKNDLLIVRTNGSKELIGRAALYSGSSYEKILFASYLIRYQLPDSDTLCKWILSIWHSGLIRDWVINQAATSAGQYNISLSKLNDLPIPLPPLTEQREIVRRVDALFAFADSIEVKVAAAREKTEKLRQSILAKAFSGELVETEAEIARREGRGYETAEVLLERIKKERGKGGKKL